MRNIVSPLDGFASPFGRRGLSKYAIGNFDPALVADFDDEYYRAKRQKTTFDGLLTHSRLSNATMVDSDGLIKWGPHNLLPYSEEFDNAAWGKSSVGSATAPVVVPNDAIAPNGTNTADKVTFSRSGDLSGDFSQLVSAAVTVEAVNYTGGVWLKAATSSDIGKQLGVRHVANSPYQVHTLTAEWVKVSNVELGVPGTRYFQIATRGTITADRDVSAHIWGAHLYRSDLGGMVNNPDRGDSYVPTTSSAVYLPRRGHHVWNGSAWVNEGLLIETEARSNLVTYSEDFTDASWTNVTITVTSGIADFNGGTGAFRLTRATTGEISQSPARTSGLAYSESIYAKADSKNFLQLAFGTSAFTANAWCNFNLATGAVGNKGTDATAHIEPIGGGWYRCTITAIANANATASCAICPLDVDAASRKPTNTTSASIVATYYQSEAGSTPSSYISTSGATVTRTPDILTIPSANLPWPTPKVIGPELVTNGTFDADTDWTKGTGWTISGGVATKAAGTGDAITQAASLVAGSVYMVTFEVSGATAGVCGPIITAGVQLTGPLSGANGTRTVYLVAPSAPTGYGVTANATFDGSIDNISVREIDPLAVSIQMDGRMTYADTDQGFDTSTGVPLGEVCPVNWRTDAANYITVAVTTAGSQTGRPSFFQESGNVVDFVLGSDTYYQASINVPYNIASRHGSTFINGAVDGTALTVNTTPVALPDLSSTNLSLAYDYMGCIRQFRVWAADLGDSGIEEASEGEPSSYLIWDASADTYIQKVYD